MRLHDFLEDHARRHGDAEFAIQGNRRLTYREASAETNRLANAFVEAGLEIGDRIAMLSKNSIEYVVLYLAASKAGIVPVPLNYRLAPREWSYIINDAGAKLLLAGNEHLRQVDLIRSELPAVERFVAVDGPGAWGWQDYHQWMAGQPTRSPDRVISEDDDLYQMYTSGTTGEPKGSVHTHRAATAHLVQRGAILKSKPGERWLLVAPVFHAAAAIQVACQSVYWGSCLYIQTDFNPFEVVRVLSEERISIAQMVPAMIQACLVAVPDANQRVYDHLRIMSYGSSPIAEQTLRSAIKVFKCDFVQGYGMTETIGLTVLSPSDHRRALAEKPQLLLSAGRPLAGTEIRIAAANDNPVPNGMTGEIVARGPQLMKGYWNRPEETVTALRGGWMHTGDAGMMDNEGYLYIQDRVKDMIVSGGENVYPRVIEQVLFQHPAVADAAVIGVPDGRWGETVKALVVLRPGTNATPDEIVEFCRDKLGRFERPRSVEFIEDLPRTASGKVLKRALREPYWIGQQRRVAGA